MKTYLFTLGLLVFVGTTGCTEVTSPADDVQPAAATYVIHTKSSFDAATATPEQRALEVEATLELRQELALLTAGVVDWAEADQKLNASLEQVSDIPAAMREQYVAATMLQSYLLAGEMTDAKAEALGRYTDMLLENGNHDGPLLVRALDRLEEYWSTEKHKNAALQALEASEDFLNKRLFCETCAAKKGDVDKLVQDGSVDGFTSASLDAVKQLRAMTR